jgi:UDP-3-O-[3-hydroxymyristoyl] N-acetylglucosamine deacetylase
MQIFQHTLARKVALSGKGVHSGRVVKMEIIPQEPNYGIKFERTDLTRKVLISADASQISETTLCTKIGLGPISVGTIEHLMAALFGLGIDNALVKVNAPELPILDGSSKEYVRAILDAGIIQQSAYKKLLVVKKPFEFHQGDKYVRIEPDSKLSYDCRIDFADPIIGKQSLKIDFSTNAFLNVADARTFCFKRDVDAMREKGLALGGSFANAVVIGDSGVLNEEGLRFEDEFVRHKLLDCIGDLALIGAPLVGKITVNKPGHDLHAHFMKALLKEKSEYLSSIEPADFGRLKAQKAAVNLAAVSSAVFV